MAFYYLIYKETLNYAIFGKKTFFLSPNGKKKQKKSDKVYNENCY
jgi:hypothetical protein